MSVKHIVHVDLYGIIARAVEEGIAYGWQCAHKHTAHPQDVQVREEIEQAVMNALCEVVRFSEDVDD